MFAFILSPLYSMPPMSAERPDVAQDICREMRHDALTFYLERYGRMLRMRCARRVCLSARFADILCRRFSFASSLFLRAPMPSLFSFAPLASYRAMRHEIFKMSLRCLFCSCLSASDEAMSPRTHSLSDELKR